MNLSSYAATCPTCGLTAQIFITRGVLECLDCAAK